MDAIVGGGLGMCDDTLSRSANEAMDNDDKKAIKKRVHFLILLCIVQTVIIMATVVDHCKESNENKRGDGWRMMVRTACCFQGGNTHSLCGQHNYLLGSFPPTKLYWSNINPDPTLATRFFNQRVSLVSFSPWGDLLRTNHATQCTKHCSQGDGLETTEVKNWWWRHMQARMYIDSGKREEESIQYADVDQWCHATGECTTDHHLMALPLCVVISHVRSMHYSQQQSKQTSWPSGNSRGEKKK